MPTTRETGKESTPLRQAVHIAMLGFALLLAVLSREEALACAFAAFVFNLIVFPRIGKKAYKPEDIDRGYSFGILIYPVSVFFLILVFPPHIAAGAWAVMALGDAMATVVGRGYGEAPLPWNRDKTWEGSAAFVVFGGLGACFVAGFVIAHRGVWPVDTAGLVVGCTVAALVAAWFESVESRIDDNLRTPFAAGAMLWGICLLGAPITVPAGSVLWGAALSGAVALIAGRAGAVNLGGMLAGFGLGFAIYLGLGPGGFLTLLAFFAVGTICTRIGYSRKHGKGLAQEGRGARGARNALANGLVPAFFAILAGFGGDEAVRTAATLAFAGALAAAASDTVSSELGQLWGRRPVMITTLKPAAAGVDGAVTLSGLIAGAGAALLMALTAAALGLVSPTSAAALVFWAGLGGNLMDSLLGAVFERRGKLGNEEVNFICTLTGALICWLVFFGTL